MEAVPAAFFREHPEFYSIRPDRFRSERACDRMCSCRRISYVLHWISAISLALRRRCDPAADILHLSRLQRRIFGAVR